MQVRVKICCIASLAEARAAIAAGASALGLVAEMPSGQGPIGDDRIAAIAAIVPPPIATFLLTSRTTADGIVAHLRHCRTDTVQIVDAVDPSVHEAVRRALPQVS